MIRLRYKITIIVVISTSLLIWMVSGGILSNNPTMICYQAFDCVPSDISFLSCIYSDMQGISVVDYCADPELVKITEGGSVKIKMPSGKTLVVGN